MNWKRVKRTWNAAKKISLTGTLFWICETTYFLIVEGWHWKAVSKAEKMCDNIVNSLWLVALALGSIAVFAIVEYLLKDEKHE